MPYAPFTDGIKGSILAYWEDGNRDILGHSGSVKSGLHLRGLVVVIPLLRCGHQPGGQPAHGHGLLVGDGRGVEAQFGVRTGLRWDDDGRTSVMVSTAPTAYKFSGEDPNELGGRMGFGGVQHILGHSGSVKSGLHLRG